MNAPVIPSDALPAMLERHVAAGETIYSEGDASDAVYIIDAGEVEVLRLDPRGNEILLGDLHRGQLFGEMGVIRDTARSTTVRAKTELTLLALDKAAFLAAFGSENPLVLPVLRMLCERLSGANELADRPRADIAGATVADIAEIRLLPASHSADTQIGSEGVLIDGLPYCVGRKPLPGDEASEVQADLLLGTRESFEISQQHFAIEDDNGRLVVRDLGSDLGTVVNGLRVAEFELSSVARLQFGKNLIQPGGINSSFQFTIAVERQ